MEIITRKEIENYWQRKKTMTDKQIGNFIMYYERLTKHMLKTLPKKADTVISIDEKHRLKK